MTSAEKSRICPINDKYPQHVGIIMDGNGRWATKRGMPRTAGHYEGVKAAKRVTAEASRLSIPYLTYYVFSTENWKRPEQEISYLMDLLATRLYGEIDFYQNIGAHVVVRGDISRLSDKARDAVLATEEATRGLNHLTVALAINYGGQDEIARAVNRWLDSRSEAKNITLDDIKHHLDLPFIPPVDLIIRTGGEKRLSNFLLWDSAYAEFSFYDTLWPDWGARELQSACDEFANRVRRFGGILS
jgi:undecaprenyl diphosphate synthase